MLSVDTDLHNRLSQLQFRLYPHTSVAGSHWVAEKITPGQELLLLRIPENDSLASLYWFTAIGKLETTFAKADLSVLAACIELGPTITDPMAFQLILAGHADADQVANFIRYARSQPKRPGLFASLPTQAPENWLHQLYRKQPSRRHWDALRGGALPLPYKLWRDLLAPEVKQLLERLIYAMCLGIEGDPLWHYLETQVPWQRPFEQRECDRLLLRSGLIPPTDKWESLELLYRLQLIQAWYNQAGRLILDVNPNPPSPTEQLILSETDPRLRQVPKDKVVAGLYANTVLPGAAIQFKLSEQGPLQTEIAYYEHEGQITTKREDSHV